LAGVRRSALEQPDAVAGAGPHHVSRAVRRPVVDHQHGEVPAGQCHQAVDAGADDQFLVQAGDDEDEEQIVRPLRENRSSAPRRDEHPQRVEEENDRQSRRHYPHLESTFQTCRLPTVTARKWSSATWRRPATSDL
jgi:hypothetical protein